MTPKLVLLIRKSSTKSNANDTPQVNINRTPTAPPRIHNLQNNHTLFLVPRNYRNALAITEHISRANSFPRSPAFHIAFP